MNINYTRKRKKAGYNLIVMIKLIGLFVFLSGFNGALAQKITITSGKFSDPAVWSPAGIPTLNDQVTIQSGHIITLDSNSSVKFLTIQDNAKLLVNNSYKISITQGIILNGRLELTDGDIELINTGSVFKMGPLSYLNWSPADNTQNGASLFLNGVEELNPTSTINIEKWYNYTNTPLGSVVSGNFGNVIINTLLNGLIFEWDQKNQFEQHVIMGTLTINQGWVVLDKSGSINNTFINAIHLKNLNSYLEFHSGNHSGTFTVKTNEILNTGGTINGIINGNGNVKLEVHGDFTNLGNVCLIYNSGVVNIGNGNSYLDVSGKFTQTHGDFRGIFNISSTNSGKTEIEIGEAEITGGIFMANYGCHTGTLTSKLKINGDLTLNFSSSNGKFRGNGLTSLSGIHNTVKLLFTVGGKFTVNGVPGSEFISSGSTGTENVTISGDAVFNGGNSYFNAGSHLTELLFEQSLISNGGYLYLSKSGGTLSAFVNKDVQVNAGNLNIKGSTGNSNLTILGDYVQSGGTVMFHNNIAEPTSQVVYVAVHGNFSNNSGSLIFDNNTESTTNHQLSLNGEQFNVGGNALVTSAGNLSNPVYGIIYYDHIGELQYHSTGTAVTLQHIKQVISSGCTLKISTGNLQNSSTNVFVSDLIKVEAGGVLDLVNQQVYSNQQGLYSGIYLDEDGRIKTSINTGLYDGTSNGAINALGNMIYVLHPNSVVEYYGSNQQVITGTGIGSAQTDDQQYGLLEINKNSSKVFLNASNVTVRTGIYLNKGEFDLNGYNLVLSSGKTYAITRTAGYIRSESANPRTSGQVKWKNIEPGFHSIPFGLSEQKIVPVTFVPITGTGKEFTAATKSSTKDNRPLPSGIFNLNLNGTDGGNDKIIDRWFYIQAPGITADITLSYLPEENSTQTGYSTGNFSVMAWGNMKWNLLGGVGNGNITETGKVTLNNTTTWGYMILASYEAPQMADILEFTAKLVANKVNLNWIAKANIVADKYIIERSLDELTYVAVLEQPAMPHSSSIQNYSTVDYNPIEGISWYRLRQNGADGSEKYSNPVKIDNGSGSTNGIEITTAGPNPFRDQFSVEFMAGSEGTAEIVLSTTTGQKMYTTSLEITKGLNKFHYTSDGKLISGIYLLSISDGKTRATHKLFKYKN